MSEIKEIDSNYAFGYRIIAPNWAHNPISGEGAKKYGGRWNSPGRAMTYLGGSRALAALELLVHLPSSLSRAKEYCIIEVKIPIKSIANYPLKILPDGWRGAPALSLTTDIGDDWLEVRGQLALRVPSVLIPEETNILLNPHHPDMSKVICGEAREFRFDKRL
jgi:RES domain-containing protein